MTIKQPELWTIKIHCTPVQVEVIEEAFEDGALAVSTYDPPRSDKAQVDVLVDGKPALDDVLAKLAPLFPDCSFQTLAPQGEPLQTRLPPHTIGVEIVPVGNLDWLKKVAEDFPPLTVARWTVFGAAHREQGAKAQLPLQIDATSAFGTGEHPTTRGCLILLDQLLMLHPEAASWNMLDMGCGSGILAMAFSKACGGRAHGIDMDEQSVEIARANTRINGLSALNTYEIGLGYAPESVAQKAPYDLIMANIFADPLCEMAGDLRRHLRAGGYVILSGILTTQAADVIAAHQEQGLILDQNLILGEWSALALHAPSEAS